MRYDPFAMERWQSTYEHRVRFNLSESGVHPLSVSGLLELAGRELDTLDVRLGYGQSNGSDELRDRIAELYPDTAQASIVVTTGGAEANFAACWQLMDPAAATAVTLPNYMQVPGMLESFRIPTHPVHLVEEDGWQPNLNELESGLAKGARSILITNPSNPTGAVLTENSMSEIISLADRHGAWILADEVYRGAELHGAETPSFWGRYERALVTNSLSKAYGLPGPLQVPRALSVRALAPGCCRRIPNGARARDVLCRLLLGTDGAPLPRRRDEPPVDRGDLCLRLDGESVTGVAVQGVGSADWMDHDSGRRSSLAEVDPGRRLATSIDPRVCDHEPGEKPTGQARSLLPFY